MSGLSGDYWSTPVSSRRKKRAAPLDDSAVNSNSYVDKRPKRASRPSDLTANPDPDALMMTKGIAHPIRSSPSPSPTVMSRPWFSGRDTQNKAHVSDHNRMDEPQGLPRATSTPSCAPRATSTPSWFKGAGQNRPGIAQYAKKQHHSLQQRKKPAKPATCKAQDKKWEESLDTAWKMSLMTSPEFRTTPGIMFGTGLVVSSLAALALAWHLLLSLVHVVQLIQTESKFGNSWVDIEAALSVLAGVVGVAALLHFQQPIRRAASGFYLHKVRYPSLQQSATRLREFAKSPVAGDRCSQPFSSMRGSQPFRAKYDPQSFNQGGKDQDTDLTV